MAMATVGQDGPSCIVKCNPCIGSIRFSWQRRRYAWRLGFYYKLWIFVACLGLCLTFVLKSLIDSHSFFSNYRCGATAVSLLEANFSAMMGIVGSLGLVALLMLRLLELFGRYSIAEFMTLGKWINRLGCIMKWGPWLFAVLVLTLFCFNLVNFTWSLASPANWCSRRWTSAGTEAVRNCRMWFNGTAQCLDAAEAEAITDRTRLQSCNDGGVLLYQRFFYFIPREDGASCSFGDVLVCRAYKDLISGQNVDWGASYLAGCLGEVPGAVPEDFQHALKDNSDLYRYLSVYVQCWTWVTVGLMLLFTYMKLSTKFDSVFYQPKKKQGYLCVRLLAYATPFSN